MEIKNSKQFFKIDTENKKPIGKLILEKLENYLKSKNLNIETLTVEDLEKEEIIFPSISNEKLVEFVKKFENLSDKEIEELPEDTRMLLLKLGDVLGPLDMPSDNYLYNKDITKKHMDNVDNDIEIDGKKYGIIYPVIKNIKNEASFLMELQEGVGLGKITKIILWNSGLWITIRPPQNEDLINLYTKLTKEIELVAENTTMYGFSNINSIFYKVVWEYVLDHLVDSSLNVNPKHLAKYISILDMDTILLGVLSQLFYNGFTTELLCKNNYNLDENKKPKCNFSYKVNLDLTKLLWVDTSKLDTEMITIISKRGAKTQSINDIKLYQKKLAPVDSSAIITLNNGKTLELELTVPNIENAFNANEIFLTELRKLINKSLATMEINEENKTEEIKNKVVNIATRTLFLGIYSPYVKKMKMNNYELENKAIILEALKTLSSNTRDVMTIIDKITNFITTSTISTVAIPDFVCPLCGASQAEEPIFEHLVPVNMVNYFFTLSKLRFMKQLLESIETK